MSFQPGGISMKILCNKIKNHFVSFLTCILLSAPCQAVSLYAGDTVFLGGTTSALSPDISGLILEERMSEFSIMVDGVEATGTVSQRLRSYDGSAYLIDYQISTFDDQGLGLKIESIQTNHFYADDFTSLEVDYRLDETGVVSPIAASQQDFGLGGPVVFDFGEDSLLSGQTSRWMFVGDPTNDLVTFGSYGAALLATDTDGSQLHIPFQSYVTFVPLPASLPLLLSGLIGLFIFSKRRIRKL
jgi:hypothetical protein